ncbi:hypothetical protein EVA_09200 [gut metagenome]|uniref:Uncharacterized protein n=1 Tax=gut metagenome TaxID=749906 RepID=J9G743_9ZZZZ
MPSLKKSRPGIFVQRKLLARRVVQRKPYGDNAEIKTPFAKIKMRFANCIKQAKGDHSNERHQ